MEEIEKFFNDCGLFIFMKYEYSESLQVLAEDVSRRLFPHIETSRIKCFRSYGSSAGGVVARCHALGKLMQQAMDCDAFYALEFLGEKFNKMSTGEKVKIVIHQLMHVPKSVGRDFNRHDVVTDENVERAYGDYLKCRKSDSKIDWFKLVRSK